MEVIRTRALRGPNLWTRSTAVEAIVSCAPAERDHQLLPGFEERLRARFPKIGVLQAQGTGQPLSLADVLETAALSLQAQAMAEQARWLSLGVCLLVFAVGLAISVGYSRHITRPLAQAVDVARGIAAGDLRQPITITGRNEITDLMRALQHMQSSLSELV